ncbi:hypothetical protein HUW62_10195 [Myxococcus sp. AM011]|nr:hypothetical protein [Myxococcus sp. AM011]NVJ21587.1 hypothetical protein [Myxococcus sp. AM011]
MGGPGWPHRVVLVAVRVARCAVLDVEDLARYRAEEAAGRPARITE